MNRYVLPLFLFAGTLFFGFLYMQDPKSDPINDFQQRKHGSIPYMQVEEYKKEAQIKMGIHRQRAELEKTLGGPDLDPGRARKNEFHDTELGDSIDPRTIDLADDSIERPITLDQRMDQFLARKAEYEALADQKKKAYVREFIREARAMGFSVQVNEAMEIQSVEKIGSDSN